MVARGDLGVEMGYAELTGLQKTIIHQSRTRNRVVITATQMMESMIQNPIPTRAEVSDVANAVMDGTDAVMLSAETATGRYPLRVVEAMSEVIQGAEKYQLTHTRSRHRVEGQFRGSEEAIAMAVMYTANHMKVRAIVALTESGATPLWMRSEEHTSELQSRRDLVCRLLLEKKKKKKIGAICHIVGVYECIRCATRHIHA